MSQTYQPMAASPDPRDAKTAKKPKAGLALIEMKSDAHYHLYQAGERGTISLEEADIEMAKPEHEQRFAVLDRGPKKSRADSITARLGRRGPAHTKRGGI